jgi:hypothetical protein
VAVCRPLLPPRQVDEPSQLSTVPFFGFTELWRVFGPERLVGVFFRPRRLLNLPPTES